MHWDIIFFANSILFGIGLAMDAFSVSIANGLNEPDMKVSKGLLMSSIFGIFQFAMPLIGWICVHTVATAFEKFNRFIPWIALILLLYIGGKMLIEGIKSNNDGNEDSKKALTFGTLMVQGIATSIDALSVGFTISDYDLIFALVESVIIGAVTFAICELGLFVGKKFGTKFNKSASIIGGVILIIIGIEIFIKGFIG